MQPSSPRALDELEARVLAWVGSCARERRDATTRAFAEVSGVGIQRCRRAFHSLERAGLLVGHGTGDRRVFAEPR
jgi:hypothetical protein